MDVTVKYEDKMEKFTVDKTKDVKFFIEMVARQFGMPFVKQILLIYKDRKLGEDDKILEDSGVECNSIIHMALISASSNFLALGEQKDINGGNTVVDESYVKNLESLSKIRASCEGKLDLPQMVVIGSTSQGKSTALGLITGLEFPTSTDICTIAPCVVECKRDTTKAKDLYYITNPKTKKDISCESLDKLAQEINSIQNELGEDNKRISEVEIRVRVVGPSRDDLILIDLPGLVVNGTEDEKIKVRMLIEKYCDSERSLLLVVSAASENEKNIEAVDLANKYDPLGKRTLRVLSKFDVFDSPESRYRAIEIVSANELFNLGPHAIIARTSDTGGYNSEKEQKLFNESMPLLPIRRRGIPYLRTRLPPLFAQLIKSNLTPLLSDVREKRQQALYELNEIGEQPLNNAFLLTKCQDVLSNEYFGTSITPSLEKFQKDLHGSEKKITMDWTSETLEKDVTRPPFFQGEACFVECLKKIVQWWEPILEEFIASSQIEVENSVTGPIEKCEIPSHLKSAIKRQWISFCEKSIFPSFREECEKALREEKSFGTMNHYLTSKYGEEIVLPDEIIEDFLTRLNVPNKYVEETTKEDLKGYLIQAREKWANSYGAKTLHEQQQHRLFVAVKAAFCVEKKTLTDIILKKTISCLKKKKEHWININLLMDNEIQENAKEDVKTEMKRNDLIKIIREMKNCEDIISTMI